MVCPFETPPPVTLLLNVTDTFVTIELTVLFAGIFVPTARYPVATPLVELNVRTLPLVVAAFVANCVFTVAAVGAAEFE